MPKLTRFLSAFAALLCCGLLTAQTPSHGIFTGSSDIGATRKGAVHYDSRTQRYTVTGGGADMWGASDAFHLAWLRLSGDAVVTADVQFPPGPAIPNEKAVLMFRQSLDPGAPYADVAVHGDGHATLQYRAAEGAPTADRTFAEKHATRLRMERKGGRFTASVVGTDGKTSEPLSTTVNLRDPVYVGLGVCSHNADGLLTVKFTNVKVEQQGK